MSTFELNLSLDGVGIELDSTQLIDIIGILEDKYEYSRFLEEAAGISNYRLHEAIAGKDNLTEETVAILAKSNEPDVLKTLLYSEAAQDCLTTAQVLRIASLSPSLACAVVEAESDLLEVSTYAVLEVLADHEDASVRLEVVNHSRVPEDLLEKLTRDGDDAVANIAKGKYLTLLNDSDDEDDEEDDDNALIDSSDEEDDDDSSDWA